MDNLSVHNYGGFMPMHQAMFQAMPHSHSPQYLSKSLPLHAGMSVFPHMQMNARHAAIATQQAANASVSDDVEDEENPQLKLWRPSRASFDAPVGTCTSSAGAPQPMVVYMPFASPHFAAAMFPGAPSADMPWPMTSMMPSATFSVAPSATTMHHHVHAPLVVPAPHPPATPVAPPARAEQVTDINIAASGGGGASVSEPSSSSNSSEGDSDDTEEWENQETIVGSSATGADGAASSSSSTSSSSPANSPPMSSHVPVPTMTSIAYAAAAAAAAGSSSIAEPPKRSKVPRIPSAGRRRKEFTQQEKDLMELRDLNRFASTAGLPAETLHAVKQLRRRLHNRRYARISRARAAERGSSSTDELSVAQDEALARTLKAVDGLLAMRNPDK